MIWTFPLRCNLSVLASVSTAGLVLLASTLPLRAHEVLPAISDMEQVDDRLEFNTRLSIESFIAGIDLGTVIDTNTAPQAELYDELRALDPQELAARFDAFWPDMQSRITVSFDGVEVPVEAPVIVVGPVGNVELVRESELFFSAEIPDGAETVVFGWDSAFGTIVLRQQGVEAPYDGFLQQGATSDPIPLATPRRGVWGFLSGLFD
ncbi:MAG: hypothetical protein AAFQ64_05380 [Pseudomonadota bacterium]